MNSSAGSLRVRDKWIALLILAALFAVASWKFFSAEKISQPGQYDDFARCLAGKGATMYGADWCAHCQNEKLAFGDSFRLVPYVECPQNIQACLDKGIEGYPTWIFPGGQKLAGEQGLEKLAAASGCPLIKN